MKTHRFDPVSFTFGVLFSLIGVAVLVPVRPFGFVEVLRISGRWLWPAVLLAVGLAVISSAVRRGAGDD